MGGFGEQNKGRGGAILTPTTFLLLGVLTSVPILVKIDQEMRPWECSQTDANRFYNLQPHAVCYGYGTDKNTVHPAAQILATRMFVITCWGRFHFHCEVQLAWKQIRFDWFS